MTVLALGGQGLRAGEDNCWGKFLTKTQRNIWTRHFSCLLLFSRGWWLDPHSMRKRSDLALMKERSCRFGIVFIIFDIHMRLLQ